MIANSKGNWGIGEYFILFSASRKRFKMFCSSVSLKISDCSFNFSNSSLVNPVIIELAESLVIF